MSCDLNLFIKRRSYQSDENRVLLFSVELREHRLLYQNYSHWLLGKWVYAFTKLARTPLDSFSFGVESIKTRENYDLQLSLIKLFFDQINNIRQQSAAI